MLRCQHTHHMLTHSNAHTHMNFPVHRSHAYACTHNHKLGHVCAHIYKLTLLCTHSQLPHMHTRTHTCCPCPQAAFSLQQKPGSRQLCSPCQVVGTHPSSVSPSTEEPGLRSAEITEQPDTGTGAWLGTARKDMLWALQTPDPDEPEPEVPAPGVGAKGQGPWIPHGRACLQPLNKGAEALEKRPEEVAVMMVHGPAPPLRPWSTVS